MAILTATLSPQFPAYLTNAPDGLRPNISTAGIAGRLILQDGTTGTRDEFSMDVLSIPYKVFAGANWKSLLPERGDTISGFPNMVVWDPMRSFSIGRAWVELKMQARGLMAENGVNGAWNGYTLNPKPVDSTGIATVSISGTDGASTATVTFQRPQTTYRFVTNSENVTLPPTINNAYDASTNPNGRKPEIIAYSVTLATGEDGSGPITGFNLGSRLRCNSLNQTQIGAYWQNEAVIVWEYFDTASGS